MASLFPATQSDYRNFAPLIAAELAGMAVTFVTDFDSEKANADFVAKSPALLASAGARAKNLPLLETSEGGVVVGGVASSRLIARLRPGAELLGTSIFAEGQVESWLGWCANELEVPMTEWLFPVLGLKVSVYYIYLHNCIIIYFSSYGMTEYSSNKIRIIN